MIIKYQSEAEIETLKKELLNKRIERLEGFAKEPSGVIDRTETAKEALLVVAELQLELSLCRLNYEQERQSYKDSFLKQNETYIKGYSIFKSALLSIRNHKHSDATVEILKEKASKAISQEAIEVDNNSFRIG